MPAFVTFGRDRPFVSEVDAFLNDEGVWSSDSGEFADFLNAFTRFHLLTYGPSQGFFQGYILGLLGPLGVTVEWETPTTEEIEAAQDPDRIY